MANKITKERELLNESMLKMSIALHSKLKNPSKLLFRMLQKYRIKSLTMVLLESSSSNLEEFIESNKRKTDLLISLTNNGKMCLVVCQDTKVDGGYYFYKRLSTKWRDNQNETKLRATILAIESTSYELWDLIFTLIDQYRQMKLEKKLISYKTIK